MSNSETHRNPKDSNPHIEKRNRLRRPKDPDPALGLSRGCGHLDLGKQIPAEFETSTRSSEATDESTSGTHHSATSRRAAPRSPRSFARDMRSFTSRSPTLVRIDIYIYICILLLSSKAAVYCTPSERFCCTKESPVIL